MDGKQKEKGESQRKRLGERGEKEGQTERWKVPEREGVFMSGCRRHSRMPSKRKPGLIESKRAVG